MECLRILLDIWKSPTTRRRLSYYHNKIFFCNVIFLKVAKKYSLKPFSLPKKKTDLRMLSAVYEDHMRYLENNKKKEGI